MQKKKFKTLDQIVKEIEKLAGDKRRKVLVSGKFNVIHPGHTRFLNFAATSGDFLIVCVVRDGAPGIYIPEDLRFDGVNHLNLVNYCFLAPEPLENCIEKIKPDIVVKGKEHEKTFNKERALIESYGGKLIFSSGEVRFSSMDILQKELVEINRATINKPVDFLDRHNTNSERVANLINGFKKLKVIVVGDLIIDEYITCDPLGMSREDPTIVLTPIRKDIFVGGAGIVSAHAKGMGASVEFFTVAGKDAAASFAKKSLSDHGVTCHLIYDPSRKTTLKQRYRAHGKTLMRLSYLDEHEISSEIARKLKKTIAKKLAEADLLVFSDFNYGCLPQSLVSEIINMCRENGVAMVADSQSSSQVGDISRYEGMLLITPTEHEARIALRDQDLGLAALASALRQKTNSKNIFITLGSEGTLIESEDCNNNEYIADQLPAFNMSPKDVAGAGDSMLICASMALSCGASGWEAAYLGSVAAACQVGRVGNFPLTSDEILQELAF